MPNARDEFVAMMKKLGMDVEVMTLDDLTRMLLDREPEQNSTPPQILSKTELTNRVIEGKTRECFEHTMIGAFDITEMRKLSPLLARVGRVEQITTLVAPLAEHVRSDRDFEQARVDALSPEAINDPVLAVQMPDGDAILIDGSHRVLRRQQENLKTLRMYLWPLALAEDLGRIQPGWGKLPGVDWGDPEFFAKKLVEKGHAANDGPDEGENHDK